MGHKDTDDPMHIITTEEDKTFDEEEDKLLWYCGKRHTFASPQRASLKEKKSGINKGAYADGSIDKFVRRLSAKIGNPRLDFIFGEKASGMEFEAVLEQLMGYGKDNSANVTILDLSGIPFEVISITVSLITRVLFDYGYYFRRSKEKCDTPLLLVYEEAHKYAPKSELA